MKYTIFVPISREHLAPKVIQNLLNLEFPVDQTEVIIYLDTDNITFIDQTTKALEYLKEKREIVARMIISGEKPLADDAPLIMRRQRVMSVWNKMKEKVGDTKYFFGFEDDMIIPSDAFNKLMLHVELGAYYAEGVARHRQFNSIGAWRMTRKTARTLQYQSAGKDWIDGGGWYCFATRTEFVKKARIREDGAPFGPDVCFVYDLVKQGNKRNLALIDWSVKCGHIVDGEALYADENSGQLFFNKVKGDWERKE